MAQPVHREEARKFVFGVGTLALLAVAGTVGGIVQTGGALPVKSYTYVHADFSDVGVLKTGKEVKQHGLRVGVVSGIDYDDGIAKVTLRLDGDREVYQDAELALSNTSALGRQYVSLDPGTNSAGELGDATLPTSQTSDASSLEDVLSVLDPATRKAAQAAIRELGIGLTGHGADLNALAQTAPDLLADLQKVSGSLTSSHADLAGLLASADRLSGRLAGHDQELAELLVRSDQTLDALTTDEARPLAESVDVLPSTLSEAKSALDALNAPLRDARVALTQLRPGGRSLGTSAADLRGLLREAVSPLKKWPEVNEMAEPAFSDLVQPVRDAQPLVPQVGEALSDAQTLLFGLAPYAADAGMFFSHHDLLSGRLGPGRHYFAAMLTSVGLWSVNGLPDPLYVSEPYPDPGTSQNKSTVTGGRR
jgi:phospholipid/cholesterol/gamma-HCH transport system substrate-binding protein